MLITVSCAGEATKTVRSHVGSLVEERVASRIFDKDATLWGQKAESEASIRLGWVEAPSLSRPLVSEILELRESFVAQGLHRVVLCGMGGSSLAPEVITRTAGVELEVLDSTSPDQIRRVVETKLAETIVVVSSKSGSTLETDSQRRAFEKAFTEAGIDPAERIVVVTDPGSPLEQDARDRGYRVFLADPNVGGRFSALTAFGLVPSGLAGADVSALLDQADEAIAQCREDSEENPALVLGAALGAADPFNTYVGIIAQHSGIVGFGEWAEQLIAESTGKEGKGLLPVVLDDASPELGLPLPDVQIVRVVKDAGADVAFGDEIAVSAPLGAQFVLWETAISVAGKLIGIDPFNQPDVESAKVAARALLESAPEPTPPLFTEDGISVTATNGLLSDDTKTVEVAANALLAKLPEGGYVAIQAYVDREPFAELAELRDVLARRTRRPVTFGWGPRFLHSTGQFHKGGPSVGVFLQITAEPLGSDLEIPERPFTFGELIVAQAQGDANVLAEHGMPVLTLKLENGVASARQLLTLLQAL